MEGLSAANSTASRSFTNVGLLLLAASIYLVFCLTYRDFVVDDAYIVGRYALNAYNGLGLVYNEGEKISALTSPLHAIVLTGLAAVSSDPIFLYRMTAPALPLLGSLLAIRIAGLEGKQSVFFLAVGLTSPFMALWALGGLETPILAALIVLFGAIFAKIWKAGQASDAELASLALLASGCFLTRFDSVLIVAPPLLFMAVTLWHRKGLWFAAIIGAAPCFGWLLFAWQYYGDVLPTSAYVKFGIFSVPVLISLVYLLNFILISGCWLLPFLLKFRQPAFDLSRHISLGVSVGLLMFLGYAAFVSSQHMMFAYRFFVPYLPYFALIAALFICKPKFALLGAGLFLPIHLVTFVVLTFQSINPVVIGIGNRSDGFPRFEFSQTSLSDYIDFISQLEKDARSIIEDSEAGPGGDKRQRIFLYTGGMGYFLLDFYIYETLVSYRHNCQYLPDNAFWSAHYVQFIEWVNINDLIHELIENGPGAENGVRFVGQSEVALDGLVRMKYTVVEDATNYSLPSLVDGDCP